MCAEAKGFYRDAGLDLEIQQPGESTDAPKLLAAGGTDFAILDIHDLGIARERGLDLVGVMPIVHRPLASILTPFEGDVRRPRDLEGRTVGVTGLPSDDAVVDAEVAADGGDPAKVEKVTIGFNAVPALASGKVDAVTGFWNAEGVELRAEAGTAAHLHRRRVRRPAIPRAGPGHLPRDARRRPRARRSGGRRDHARLRLQLDRIRPKPWRTCSPRIRRSTNSSRKSG